jgi:hypothetical protein
MSALLQKIRAEAYNYSMPRARKHPAKPTLTAPERLFKAAFGREMTPAERKRFVWERPLSLEELARREGNDIYSFLRQT